jgi:hypothetical protein
MVTPRHILITSVVLSKRVKMKTKKLIYQNDPNNVEDQTELTIEEQIEQFAEIIISFLLKELYEN